MAVRIADMIQRPARKKSTSIKEKHLILEEQFKFIGIRSSRSVYDKNQMSPHCLKFIQTADLVIFEAVKRALKMYVEKNLKTYGKSIH